MRGTFLQKLSRTLAMSGVVTLLVGLKLVLSYFVPGLRRPGELLWSGGLLLAYSYFLFSARAEAERALPAGRK